MVSAKDVPADALIKSLTEELKKIPEINPPEWALFVKTGPHAERRPVNDDWWYVRCASILRKISIEGKVGVGRLRTWYGGRKNFGSAPEHHVDAGGKIIRTALQQLEKAGLVKKEKVGRSLTPKGSSLVNKTATKIKEAKDGRRAGKDKNGETEKTSAATGRTEKTSRRGGNKKSSSKSNNKQNSKS